MSCTHIVDSYTVLYNDKSVGRYYVMSDGGTIRCGIPEEWFSLPYGKFLDNVVTLAAAAHYGFTPELLMSRECLRAFFGYGEKEDNNSK